MSFGKAFQAFFAILKGADWGDLAVLDEKQKELDLLKNKVKELEASPSTDEFTDGANYALVLFQREGRLIDFLQENIDAYQDAQIGTAVRQIHSGCKKVLEDHYQVEAIRKESENAQVSIEENFDPQLVKLSGNVPATGPYSGTLVHRGWKVGQNKFPARSTKINGDIIQAAEVQI
ncbi:MAG: DUF2760 domain-containing protein [Lentisphaeria bacterium]|nr:DUF2760 domain-containing protein [Lentisphaeria bacterium]